MRRLAPIAALLIALCLVTCPIARADKTQSDKGGLAASLLDLTVEQRLKIDPALLKTFAQTETGSSASLQVDSSQSFLVYLHAQAPIASLSGMPNLMDRREALVRELQQTAAVSQKSVAAYLAKEHTRGNVSRYQSYWVFNGFAVDAHWNTLLELAARPDVEAIRPNRVRRLPEPVAATAGTNAELTWNIAKVGVEQVWETLGVTGQGIVIANIDSGVDWTHPALQPHYRGYNPNNPSASSHDYNWFDPTGTYPNAPGPNQANISGQSDHGTHTMGVLVGQEPDGEHPIGMAPGATWIAVKAFADDGASLDEWIHASFQWCLAPTDLNGENPDPSKAPDIVNCLWGDDNGADETFRQDLAAWEAAGIFSAWAGGNAGPESHTINSPGSYAEAMAVGASTSEDGISSFSSRGPSPWGDIKPDIVAPGMTIYSSIAGGGYDNWNGTSMATPHVCGLAALLLSSTNNTLSLSATRYAITSTAVPLGEPGPDNTYGHGRIDALQAVRSVISAGTFAGHVRDGQTQESVGGAEIIMRNLATGAATHTTTAGDGSYAFGVASGMYNVTVQAFGYKDGLATDIQVLNQTITQLDFALELLPSGTIQGLVETASGSPVSDAAVMILDTPIELKTDAGGTYSATLPVGDYDLRIMPPGAGSRGCQTTLTVTLDETIEHTCVLSKAPRVLLVEADAWINGSVSGYYEAALREALLGYDSYHILLPPSDVPTEAQMLAYDAVIWSHGTSSPGYISAWGALGRYLEQGGRLLISGQDIGYWDVGYGYANTAYETYLHASYLEDSAGLDDLIGQQGSLFEGIELAFGGIGTAEEQQSPDLIAPASPLASPGLRSVTSEPVGLLIEACDYRAIYCSFGIESVGPVEARAQLLETCLSWLAEDTSTIGPLLTTGSAGQVVSPGTDMAIPIEIAHRGDGAIDLNLAIDSPSWPAIVASSTGQEITRIPRLDPCEVAECQVIVQVPETARLGESQTIRLTVLSTNGTLEPVSVDLQVLVSQGWARQDDLTEGRQYAASVADDCIIYLIGGLNTAGWAMEDVSRYDLTTEMWEQIATLPIACADSATALIGSELYVIGGHTPGGAAEYIADVQVLNIDTGQWRTETSLPVAMAGASVAVYADHIYLFGGVTATGEVNTALRFDPSAPAWVQRHPAPANGLSHGAAETLGNSIYVAGGWPQKRSLYRYLPEPDAWQTLPPMRDGRHSFVMVSDERNLYVAGGGHGEARLSTAERYNAAQNIWIPLPNLSFSARVGTTGVYAGGRLYAIGGADSAAKPYVESLDIAPPFGGSSLHASTYFARPGDTIDMTLDRLSLSGHHL